VSIPVSLQDLSLAFFALHYAAQEARLSLTTDSLARPPYMIVPPMLTVFQ